MGIKGSPTSWSVSQSETVSQTIAAHFQSKQQPLVAKCCSFEVETSWNGCLSHDMSSGQTV